MNPGFPSFRTAEHAELGLDALTEPVRNHIYIGNLKSLHLPVVIVRKLEITSLTSRHCSYLSLHSLLSVTDWSVLIMSGYWENLQCRPYGRHDHQFRRSQLLFSTESHLVSNAERRVRH